MGVQPPFIYDEVRSGRPFDPKAVTRASQQPKPRKPKQDGPLISFNQHPDSYLILPYGNTTAKPMNPSVKKWIKWLRILQLVLRSLELLCALGLLVLMILIRGMDATTGWIMRIAPGIAILHTVYGIYHLCRKPSGRTPASSASYMLFASFFDVSIIPFYAFSALVAKTRQEGWNTVLPNQALMPMFSTTVFYLAAAGAGLHLVTLILSIYLAVTFRKITKLPPDMNPLEDNLTSRHKRNKSSITTATTVSEKRISAPLESKRSSGNAYEDLSRPPTIPFFHTRTQSTDSFSTYKDTPPPSRDARNDLPSRQYGIAPANSARSSVVDLKRTSYYNTPTTSPTKQRGSYTELPLSDSPTNNSTSNISNDFQRLPHKIGNMTEAWYTADSFSAAHSSPKKATYGNTKGGYQPVTQPYDYENTSDISFSTFSHPKPLSANPPTPNRSRFHRLSQHNNNSPLSEISTNRRSSSREEDIANMSHHRLSHNPPSPNPPSHQRDNFKAKYYGELKPGTPPIMIGGGRQASSGNDFGRGSGAGNGVKVLDRREVSGKIVEEGRGGGNGGWGTRFRKISGL